MKKSRFLAAATATAVALSPVVPAEAAQIGPLDQNKCRVTFTSAEIAEMKRSEKASADIPTWKADRDISLALEQLFDIRGTGDNFISVNASRFAGLTTREAFDRAFSQADKSYALSRLRMAGLDEISGEFYLRSRASAAFGKAIPNEPWSPSDIQNPMEIEAQPLEESDIAELPALNPVTAVITFVLSLGGTFKDEEQVKKFYRAFDKTETGSILKASDPIIPFLLRASDACYRGGNTSMTWLKSTPSNTPKPPASDPSNGSNPDKPSAGTQGVIDQPGKEQGTKDEQGSSTVGIVIGVIAAVLAVIGIAAIAAPQLGIQIPGLG